MNPFLEAIVGYIKNPSNGLLSMVGSYTSGTTTYAFSTLSEDQFDTLTEFQFDELPETPTTDIEYGPFLNVNPEDGHFPYMIYKIKNINPPDQGFSPNIVEKIVLEFKLFDNSLDDLMLNLETFQTIISGIRTLSVFGQYCNAPLRRNNAIIKAQGFAERGQRAYSGTVTYEFRVSYSK